MTKCYVIVCFNLQNRRDECLTTHYIIYGNHGGRRQLNRAQCGRDEKHTILLLLEKKGRFVKICPLGKSDIHIIM